MIRKILKWIGIVLGSLIGLLVVAFAVLYVIGTVQWNRSRGNVHDVPVETIIIPTDQASITRGEHIATIRMCRYCHTEALSGQSDEVPGLITLAFPNLTAGGVGATNTDEDWVRAIRHGVGNDGRGLILMPSRVWYYLSDEDLSDLIAYLKSLPPVDNELPTTALGPLGRVMLVLGQIPPEATQPDVILIDHDGQRPVAPGPGVTAEYGEYMARTCALCHGSNFNGQTISEGGPDYLAPNLTLGGELAHWSEAQFIETLRTGITPSGHQLKKVMPWKYFGQMTDDELKAVWLYLQSLPPLPQGK
jgi:cytochrome c553